MSISMSIKELESEKALCRDDKKKTVQVFLSDIGKFAQYCDKNRYIDLSAAEQKLGKEKVAEIKKRNRVRSTGEITADKIKEKKDLETLKPFTREETTKWVTLQIHPKNAQEDILKSGLIADSVTAWDALGFDEMYAICAKCELSWDKGRGCIATLIPSDSPLPEIANKYGLKYIAGIPKYAEKGAVFDSSEAKQFLSELKQLRDKLPGEGKMMVRRLSGAMDRLEAIAKTCSDKGVKMYFS